MSVGKSFQKKKKKCWQVKNKTSTHARNWSNGNPRTIEKSLHETIRLPFFFFFNVEMLSQFGMCMQMLN